MNLCCKSCVFWGPLLPDNARGLCKRHAPRRVTAPYHPTTTTYDLRPTTDASDWCGEYSDYVREGESLNLLNEIRSLLARIADAADRYDP